MSRRLTPPRDLDVGYRRDDTSARDDLVQRLMPQPPAAWDAMAADERSRTALYAVVAMLSGIPAARAWRLALQRSPEAEQAIDAVDRAVTVEALRRMVVTERREVGPEHILE